MIKIPYYETSHFAFSNFSPHMVVVSGVIYPTVEHAYHAAKFEDKNIRKEIQQAKSPLEAFNLSRKYKDNRKNNWDEIKVEVLYGLVNEKVNQHTEVRDALLSTGNEEIVEDNPNDDFWGSGKDGKGQNNMGKILMRIRSEIVDSGN